MGRKVNFERNEIFIKLFKCCSDRQEFIKEATIQMGVSEKTAIVYFYKLKKDHEVDWKEKFNSLVIAIEEKFNEAKTKKKSSSQLKQILEIAKEVN